MTERVRATSSRRPTREQVLAATPDELVGLVWELAAERDQLAELVEELEAERDALADALAEERGIGF
jgi:hypothetical protein